MAIAHLKLWRFAINPLKFYYDSVSAKFFILAILLYKAANPPMFVRQNAYWYSNPLEFSTAKVVCATYS